MASVTDKAQTTEGIAGQRGSAARLPRFEGVPARITNPARTVVDCFRFERLIGREAAMEALRDALRRKLITVDALYRTIEVLPSRRLKAVLEAM